MEPDDVERSKTEGGEENGALPQPVPHDMRDQPDHDRHGRTDDEGQRAPLRADEGAVVSALINLLDNALKYSPDEKRVVVRVSRAADGVVFEVQERVAKLAGDQELATDLQRQLERMRRLSDRLPPERDDFDGARWHGFDPASCRLGARRCGRTSRRRACPTP